MPPATESSANEAAMLLADIVSGLGLDARFAEVREGVQAGLRATFAELAAAGCTRDERIAMGKWLVNRMGHEVSPAGGEPWSRVSVWAATPGRAMQALTAIREQQQAVANVQDQLAAAKKALGIQ